MYLTCMHLALFIGMNQSNEIATFILNANMTGIHAILENPQDDHKYAEVYNMTYISSNRIYTFTGAGIKNSGQSSKDYAKQSWKIKLDKYHDGPDKPLLFGRTAVKLRAHDNDPTFA